MPFRVTRCRELSFGQSLTDRTLDQMCGVTRLGLVRIAATTSVEILVSLLQHPQGSVHRLIQQKSLAHS
jgi:hypothetical protein